MAPTWGRDSDVPADAKMVALFDTLAAMLASLVIIPAMAVAGEQLNNSGPGLMFIFLPNVISRLPGGPILLVVFFLAVLFAALTSLVNLFEAPTATLQELFHLKRPAAVAIIGAVGVGVGLAIAPIVSDWMDVCSIYICPIGALAGRGNVLLGVWKGLCAGAGQSVPKQAPGPLVLPHGQISVLRRHPAGTDLGRPSRAALAESDPYTTCGPPKLGGPQTFHEEGSWLPRSFPNSSIPPMMIKNPPKHRRSSSTSTTVATQAVTPAVSRPARMAGSRTGRTTEPFLQWAGRAMAAEGRKYSRLIPWARR